VGWGEYIVGRRYCQIERGGEKCLRYGAGYVRSITLDGQTRSSVHVPRFAEIRPNLRTPLLVSVQGRASFVCILTHSATVDTYPHVQRIYETISQTPRDSESSTPGLLLKCILMYIQNYLQCLATPPARNFVIPFETFH
jgi:hypothetical protein